MYPGSIDADGTPKLTASLSIAVGTEIVVIPFEDAPVAVAGKDTVPVPVNAATKVPVVGNVTFVVPVDVSVTEFPPALVSVDPADSVRVPVPAVTVLPLMVLLLKASIPASVAKVPVAGNCTLVGAVEVNVSGNAPEVAKVDPVPKVKVPVPAVMLFPLIVLLVKDSVPVRVAKVPVAGKVTFVRKGAFKVILLDPVNVKVLVLLIPVPPLFDGTIPETSPEARSTELQFGKAPPFKKVVAAPTGSLVPVPPGLI